MPSRIYPYRPVPTSKGTIVVVAVELGLRTHWTAATVDALVGQRPAFFVRGRAADSPVCTVQIVDAGLDHGGRLVLSLRVPPSHAHQVPVTNAVLPGFIAGTAPGRSPQVLAIGHLARKA